MVLYYSYRSVMYTIYIECQVINLQQVNTIISHTCTWYHSHEIPNIIFFSLSTISFLRQRNFFPSFCFSRQSTFFLFPNFLAMESYPAASAALQQQPPTTYSVTPAHTSTLASAATAPVVSGGLQPLLPLSSRDICLLLGFLCRISPAFPASLRRPPPRCCPLKHGPPPTTPPRKSSRLSLARLLPPACTQDFHLVSLLHCRTWPPAPPNRPPPPHSR